MSSKKKTKKFSKKDYEEMSRLDKKSTEIIRNVSIYDDDGTGIRIPGVSSMVITDEEIEKDLEWLYEKMDEDGVLD